MAVVGAAAEAEDAAAPRNAAAAAEDAAGSPPESCHSVPVEVATRAAVVRARAAEATPGDAETSAVEETRAVAAGLEVGLAEAETGALTYSRKSPCIIKLMRGSPSNALGPLVEFRSRFPTSGRPKMLSRDQPFRKYRPRDLSLHARVLGPADEQLSFMPITSSCRQRPRRIFSVTTWRS